RTAARRSSATETSSSAARVSASARARLDSTSTASTLRSGRTRATARICAAAWAPQPAMTAWGAAGRASRRGAAAVPAAGRRGRGGRRGGPQARDLDGVEHGERHAGRAVAEDDDALDARQAPRGVRGEVPVHLGGEEAPPLAELEHAGLDVKTLEPEDARRGRLPRAVGPERLRDRGDAGVEMGEGGDVARAEDADDRAHARSSRRSLPGVASTGGRPRRKMRAPAEPPRTIEPASARTCEPSRRPATGV